MYPYQYYMDNILSLNTWTLFRKYCLSDKIYPGYCSSTALYIQNVCKLSSYWGLFWLSLETYNWITVSNLLFKQSHQSKMQFAGPVIWVNKKIKVAPRILLLNSCVSWPYCLINLCSYCMPWFCLSIIHFWLVDVCIIIIICIYGYKNY